MYTYNLTQRKTELFGSCYRRNKTKLGGRCRFIRALSLSMYDQSMSLRTEMSIYFCSFYCILSLMIHVIFFLLFTLTQQRALNTRPCNYHFFFHVEGRGVCAVFTRVLSSEATVRRKKNKTKQKT